MLLQENAFLMEELQNTTDEVKKIEGQVIEIARLQVYSLLMHTAEFLYDVV